MARRRRPARAEGSRDGPPAGPVRPGRGGRVGGRLVLRLRARVEAPDAGGTYRTVETPAGWDPRATAIIVCDMWDLHHSRNATLRLEEMAPRMDRMLRPARARGVLIIPSPGGGHPSRAGEGRPGSPALRGPAPDYFT